VRTEGWTVTGGVWKEFLNRRGDMSLWNKEKPCLLSTARTVNSNYTGLTLWRGHHISLQLKIIPIIANRSENLMDICLEWLRKTANSFRHYSPSRTINLIVDPARIRSKSKNHSNTNFRGLHCDRLHDCLELDRDTKSQALWLRAENRTPYFQNGSRLGVFL
jgi:hypothetical protein